MFGENWGAPTVEAGKGLSLASARGEDGKSFLNVPADAVKHVTGTKTEVTLALKAPEGSEGGAYTSELRFAVPKACAAFGDDEEEPAKAMLTQVRKAVGGAAAVAPVVGGPKLEASNVKQEGKILAKFDKIPFASPVGLYNIVITDAVVSFTEPKKNVQFTVAHAQVDKCFTIDSTLDDSKKYFAIGMRAPIKIGASPFSLVTIALNNEVPLENEKDVRPAYSAEDPWKAEISAEEIAKRYPQGSLFNANMDGLLSDILCKVFKTVLNCKLLTGAKDFGSHANRQIAGVRCAHRSNVGGLYMLKEYFLFLCKPATLVPWADVNTIAIDSTRDSTNFTLTFNCKKSAYSTTKAAEEKYPFVSIARSELHNLRKYLSEEKKFMVSCPEFDDMDDDEDDEESEDDEEEDDDESEDDSDDDGDDSEDSDDKPKKKKKKASKKEKKKKEKKDKKDKHKKEKKDKHKKEKKDKHKKEKKDKSSDRQKRDRDDE